MYKKRRTFSVSSIAQKMSSTTRAIAGGAVAIGTTAGIVSAFGWEGLAFPAVSGFCGAGYQVYRLTRRVRDLQSRLTAELSHHHRFLVEFLNTTYLGSERDVIVKRNAGASVLTYKTTFNVFGTDCENQQEITGINDSNVPLRGVAFALVGGSSISTEALGSLYSAQGVSNRAPEFLIDEERFKVAFCEFGSPLPRNGRFSVSYTDNWKGAMRQESDGFFFPEATYFLGGVSELVVRLNFAFPIDYLACLEVNSVLSSVVACDSQPESIAQDSSFQASFVWRRVRPSAESIFVLYYRAQ